MHLRFTVGICKYKEMEEGKLPHSFYSLASIKEEL